MMDNLVFATDSIRTSVTSLKKKLSNVKVTVEQFDAELEKIQGKFDKLQTQADIYKAKLERECNREVRKLQMEVDKLRKQLASDKATIGSLDVNPTDLNIASTIAVFECILRHICQGADDFRLISYSFLFPAILERLVLGDDPAYFLDELPSSCETVILRGRQYVSYIRNECPTHITDPEAWEKFSLPVTDWWRNDALPLLYGSRDEQWEVDVPLSLTEMLMWRDDPAERPLNFSPIFDAFEIYKKNKDAVYDTSGVRAFDLKMFTFSSSTESPSDEG